MADAQLPDLRNQIDSLTAWWRDAGVDVAIEEAPQNWLAEAKSRISVAPAEAVAAIERTRPSPPAPASAGATPIRAEMLPDTLAAFQAWLATDATVLGDYPVRQRVAPQGNPAAGIMIVTDVPERDDAHEGRLLGGEAGALFDKMLAAWKVGRSGIYLAALAPARPPRAILDEAETALLAPVLARHIALAAPKKLWLLGEAASRAVLGMNVAAATGRLHLINYDGTKVEAIATLHPRVLLREPKSKARVWADMQRLIGPEDGDETA